MSAWVRRLLSRLTTPHIPPPAISSAENARREELRNESIAANRQLHYAADDAEAESRFRTWRERDPYPEIAPALLNSADIADYVAKTGMIYPFNPDRLKPASYEIALLGKYLYVDSEGKRCTGEIRRGQRFILKRNSIAFLSVEPFFRLPDYIALRHNLKISNVYKGLLVGTGPLVDPGFVGRISLPLHNLTNQDYEFLGGEGIIWIEFTKLSPYKTWEGGQGQSDRNGVYTPFPIAKTELEDVEDYVFKAVRTGALPSSSIADVARRTRRASKIAVRTRKTVYAFGIAGLLAGVLAVLLATFQIIIPTIQLQQQTNSDLRTQQLQISNLQHEVKHLQAVIAKATVKPKP